MLSNNLVRNMKNDENVLYVSPCLVTKYLLSKLNWISKCLITDRTNEFLHVARFKTFFVLGKTRGSHELIWVMNCFLETIRFHFEIDMLRKFCEKRISIEKSPYLDQKNEKEIAFISNSFNWKQFISWMN